MTYQKLLILDRDGVINKDSDKFIKHVDEWEEIPESIAAIAQLTQNNWTIVVCTNQSGIARGFFSIEELNEIHLKMYKAVAQQGGAIAAVFFCSHQAEDQCECRKPKPTMILDICERFNVDDISKIAFVGDSIRDLEAIASAGGIPILVKTGNGKKTLAKFQLPLKTLVFDNLLGVSQYLIEKFHE